MHLEEYFAACRLLPSDPMQCRSNSRGPLRRTLAIACALVSIHCWASKTNAAAAKPFPLPTLTTAKQVHSLAYEESLRRYPVHLKQEQVLYYNPTLGNLFVRDSTRGVYIDMRNRPTPPLHIGDLLEVRGVSGPGGYAPVVENADVTVVGRAPLPRPPRLGLDRLLTGAEDGEWVETEGIVRSLEKATQITRYANQAASGGTTVLVNIATGAGRLDVIVREADRVDEQLLVDAKVRVRGVMGPRFNQNRQLTGIHMFAQSLAQFHVLQRGPSDPFSLPIHPISTIMRYSPDVVPEHRIRLRAVVTANRDGQLLSVADSGHGLFIHTSAAQELRVGDLIDVVGFPAMGDYTPVLEDVIYRKLGTQTPPMPIELNSEQMFSGSADAQLIRIRGRLLKQSRSLEGGILLISAGDRTFAALLPTGLPADSFASLRDDSLVELTGTLRIEVFPNKTPKGAQLLLRSAKDVVVVQQAPLWTGARALAALAILWLAVAVAIAWIALLRRRVQLQNAALRKAEEEARAISELAQAMQEVAQDRKFTARVSTRGSDGIAQLGVGFNQMLSELESEEKARQKAETKLQMQALTDELTQLPNRRLLSDRLSQSLALAQRDNRIVALLYIDLDGFKLVNDSLGHAAGDQLLLQVAQRLRARIRRSDTLARLGGDEFTVLLNSLRATAEAELVASSLLDALSRQFVVEGHEIVIGASIGISLFPEHGSDAATLLQHADSAMYAAKRNGKNQVKRYTPELGASVRERVTLETQLRGAISRGEIHLAYQPEFDLGSGRVVRFEALARWMHPSLGSIQPDKFIPIAEECGMIVTLGAYLLEQACSAAVKWQAIAPHPVQVAVNVSSLQFALPAFVNEIGEILLYTGLKPELLQIELTESIMLSGAEHAAETMRRLRELGVSLAIDDFGTGYSCLSYLPRLPFNILKIDRSFVRDLEPGSGAKAIVQSLVTLAHSLDMQVVVEGIENQRQLQIVKQLGITAAQGFFLGRPVADPASQLSIEAAPGNTIQAVSYASSHKAGTS